MKVQDALKPTGKAIDKRNKDAHIEVRFEYGANYLIWVNNKTGEYEGRLSYEAHFIEDWQPYHEVKEIRPEKAGELWQKNVDSFVYLIAEERINKLTAIPSLVDLLSFSIEKHGKDIIHGKGWTRLYPPVEDDSVERIEIEGVVWQDSDSSEAITPRGAGLKDIIKKHDLQNKPPMKMILVMQKESI